MATHITREVNKFLTKSDTVLDICCGNGQASSGLTYGEITGVDICQEYLDQYLGSVPGSKSLLLDLEAYMKKDEPEREKILPSNSYDVVLALDAIEHFEEELSDVFMKDLERVASSKVIIFTPENAEDSKLIVPNFPKNIWGTNKGDQFQVHKSAQPRTRFVNSGYKFMQLGKHKNVYDNSYYYEMLYIKEIR